MVNIQITEITYGFMDLPHEYQSFPSIFMWMHHMIQPTVEEATSAWMCFTPAGVHLSSECGTERGAPVEFTYFALKLYFIQAQVTLKATLHRHYFCCFWTVNYLHLSLNIFTLWIYFSLIIGIIWWSPFALFLCTTKHIALFYIWIFVFDDLLPLIFYQFISHWVFICKAGTIHHFITLIGSATYPSSIFPHYILLTPLSEVFGVCSSHIYLYLYTFSIAWDLHF